MALRPCMDCGVLSPAGRCPQHAAQVRAVIDKRKRERRPDRTWAERRRRAETVAAWREQYGNTCPGWQRPPHAAADLTADHVLPVGAGGAESGPLTVLCLACNGRKSDTTT